MKRREQETAGGQEETDGEQETAGGQEETAAEEETLLFEIMSKLCR
jgi:hypothetical protein